MKIDKPLFVLQDIDAEFLEDQFSKLFTFPSTNNFRSERTRQLSFAGAVVFGGGTDVNPELYEEKPDPMTDYPDFERDAREQQVFNMCVELNIPMIGICRGSQFLTVMNGGKLIQHTPFHPGNPHKIRDITTGKLIQANSYHHQMMHPQSSKNPYVFVAEAIGKNVDGDPEVIWWPETKCLCIQGHPEWVPTGHEYQVYVKGLVDNFIVQRLLMDKLNKASA